ncbi:hypothetical protein LTR78_009708 [Recurvomyces mirabilis]|uniref:Major facilitator superfamily (MFS) profile domain-containing protein n=1 Tax=Recurvomyces mirabilis TaxID=574656 RepID=A0AAE0TRG2_9PEZI|nr:hypothetical protein LTR78_009708 [Recurvomyces mirabilis]KAK5150250.1 hypothetical protein LTS14_010226 [Recurvomyces mirabilis]
MFKKALADTPREALNLRLLLAVVCFGLMGAARGLDEGLIGTTVAQKSFMTEYCLSVTGTRTAAEVAQRKGNITAMVQIGSVAGSLIAFVFADQVGRLWATRELCAVWIVGVIVYITSGGNYGQVLAGRFVMGLGIGQTTVIAPAYLSEVAPRGMRGLCVCIFSGCVYHGIMLGYFANYGTSLHVSTHSAKQWIYPTSMHIIFAGLIIILSFVAFESPRYLMKAGKIEQGAATMAKLRGLSVDHPYVRAEMIDINDQLEREQEATMGAGILGPLKELFFIGRNRYAIVLGLMCQLLGQWSGANSITIYAPQYFALLGLKGSQETLLATGVFGVVKLVAALTCAFFLVDFIGRKRALYVGITLQFISMFYIAVFLATVPAISSTAAASGKEVLTAAQQHAATGAIVFIYISGVGWALGWNSIQYLIGAEIFPLRIRSLGTSIIMCFHFINQASQSRSFSARGKY